MDPLTNIARTLHGVWQTTMTHYERKIAEQLVAVGKGEWLTDSQNSVFFHWIK